MTAITFQPFTSRRGALAALSAHLLVALIALVGVGGATRVMEAGLACPDWPLCYGSLLPGQQMNLQVFLEWFHRLDAFVVGVGLLVQAGATWWWRRELPRWVPLLSASALVLVAVQGGLGALTVTLLLPFPVVTAHLVTALLLVALLSACTQALLAEPSSAAMAPAVRYGWLPRLWPWLLGLVLVLAFGQCLLGGLMATQWAAGRCISSGEGCSWLLAHRLGARSLALAVLAGSALVAWRRPADRLLASLAAAVALAQIALGVFSLRLTLAVPAVTVAHQLGAALLVAVLTALFSRSLLRPFQEVS
ncbi:MAG: heme A synthase [Cyanobacteria bacterium M_surface_10_m2_179]|nr:heme A synthase [Cyanobacteria bacterium M_surface_10_m2_179]